MSLLFFPRRPMRLSSVATALAAVSACGEAAAPPAEAGIPVAVPELLGEPTPLPSGTIAALIDLQIARDGRSLGSRLSDEDPAVRARAALALASVQDPDQIPGLTALLGDPVAAVRRDAAFALGQVDIPDGGRALLEALSEEREPDVRRHLVEALGKRGGDEILEGFLDWSPDEEEAPAHHLALSRLALREVGGPPLALVERLAAGLDHEHPDAREGAAYYFGRNPDPDAWRALAPSVREALDGYSPSDPAAMHLVVGLARLRDREDLSRFLHRLREGEDWRVRVNATRALGAMQFIEVPGVRDALWTALEEDPSEHVAIEAARVLNSAGLFIPQSVTRRGAEWIAGDPARWRTHIPFLANIANLDDPTAGLAWAERMAEANPMAAAHGLRDATAVAGPPATDVLLRMAEHREPLVQGAAIRALGDGWPMAAQTEEDVERFFELFAAKARDGHRIPALHAALALSHPMLEPLGAVAALEAAYRAREREGEEETPVLRAILGALGEIGDPEAVPLLDEVIATSEDHRLRRAAGTAREAVTGEAPTGLRIPDPERTVDLQALEALGPAPRLTLETEKGEVVVRLQPAQAPLTVQTIAELANEGRYDGVLFHRVVANFVVQGGDFSVGDGSGSPGFHIRSEFTRIPFRRGVIGMASSGKDTESSQFFLTHSLQPHLDGGYTAFGWVESGGGVMDRLLEGDRILRARVGPGGREGDR